jgi:iron complex transport system ATP-binding protein
MVEVLGDLARDPARPLVLVTHHLEEIPPGITHALLLRDGDVVAAGPVRDTLTSEAVSATFGVPVRVEGHEGRWFAQIRH